MTFILCRVKSCKRVISRIELKFGAITDVVFSHRGICRGFQYLLLKVLHARSIVVQWVVVFEQGHGLLLQVLHFIFQLLSGRLLAISFSVIGVILGAFEPINLALVEG